MKQGEVKSLRGLCKSEVLAVGYAFYAIILHFQQGVSDGDGGYRRRMALQGVQQPVDKRCRHARARRIVDQQVALSGTGLYRRRR